MLILFIILFLLSIAINIALIWYTRKVLQNLRYAVENVDEMQLLLAEYASLLEPVATMENYYGDDAIVSAVANTKLVVEACKVFKKTILSEINEETKAEQEDSKESKE